MLNKLKEILKTIIVAGLLAVAARSLIVEHCRIPTPSLVPNLLVGDHLFVSKYAYGFSGYSFPFGIKYFEGRIAEFNKPKRGEIIVFRLPASPSVYYIKRLIGLPGDTIQMREGIVYLNGKPLEKIYVGQYYDHLSKLDFKKYSESLSDKKSYFVINDNHSSNSLNNTMKFTIPDNHYFFMGDNRDHSLDSRVVNGPVGFVPYENLIGRAEFVIFSNETPFWQIWKWLFTFKLDRFFININKI